MLYINQGGIIFITTNQGVFMATKNTLLKMATLLLLLIPLITFADDDNKIDKYADAKKDPIDAEMVIMRIDDIKAGKHSKKEKESIKKVSASKVVKKQPESKPKNKPDKKIEKKRKEKKAKPKKIEEKTEKKIETKKEKEKEIDLMEAYNEVMGIAKKKPIKKETTKTKAIPSSPKMTPVSSKSKNISSSSTGSNTIGWLYLGKFTQGRWETKGSQVLGLKDVLPKVGQFYSIRVHSNIRKGKPSKGKMPAVIKQLANGNKIKLLAVHNSGGSGHYWARVEW